MEILKQFLKFKYGNDQRNSTETQEYRAWQFGKNDGNRADDFPISLVSNGNLLSGYILDVERTIIPSKSTPKELHSLRVIIETDFGTYEFSTSCISPEGCIINWNECICAFELKTL